jgi:hypothetical protein
MHVPRPEPVAAVEGLLERVPELRAAWEEHLRLYEEPLLHVYFGDDLTRIARRAAAGRDVALLERLAQGLETLAASGDPDTESAVAVSFVEHLVLGDAADHGPGKVEAVSRAGYDCGGRVIRALSRPSNGKPEH